jgi:hypothetical protein
MHSSTEKKLAARATELGRSADGTAFSELPDLRDIKHCFRL